MHPRFFIGGTGRSGTGILYKALGQHAEIASMPTEMRFIVDPDGLRGLAQAFHENYSPVDAAEAFYRFERLMRRHLTNPSEPPFISYDFPKWFGDEYWNMLDQFCAKFYTYEYTAIPERQPEIPGRLNRAKRYLQKTINPQAASTPKDNTRQTYNWPRTDLRVYRYFSDRSSLVHMLSEFADSLFLSLAVKMNKSTWCEKTPQNLLFIEFLWELFPDSVFIHIKRDPRGVAFSVMNQAWGPNDAAGAAAYLASIYERWFDIERRLDKSKYHYLEIKLEDFARSPGEILEQIRIESGLQAKFEHVPEISVAKVDNWQDIMSKADISVLNNSLGATIEQLGYKI